MRLMNAFVLCDTVNMALWQGISLAAIFKLRKSLDELQRTSVTNEQASNKNPLQAWRLGRSESLGVSGAALVRRVTGFGVLGSIVDLIETAVHNLEMVGGPEQGVDCKARMLNTQAVEGSHACG
jgi:hypothetical protein